MNIYSLYHCLCAFLSSRLSYLLHNFLHPMSKLRVKSLCSEIAQKMFQLYVILECRCSPHVSKMRAQWFGKLSGISVVFIFYHMQSKTNIISIQWNNKYNDIEAVELLRIIQCLKMLKLHFV